MSRLTLLEQKTHRKLTLTQKKDFNQASQQDTLSLSRDYWKQRAERLQQEQVIWRDKRNEAWTESAQLKL